MAKRQFVLYKYAGVNPAAVEFCHLIKRQNHVYTHIYIYIAMRVYVFMFTNNIRQLYISLIYIYIEYVDTYIHAYIMCYTIRSCVHVVCRSTYKVHILTDIWIGTFIPRVANWTETKMSRACWLVETIH